MSASRLLLTEENTLISNRKEDEKIIKYHGASSINSVTIVFLFATIATAIYHRYQFEDTNLNKPIERLKNETKSENKTFTISENEIQLDRRKKSDKQAHPKKLTLTSTYDRKILQHINEGELLFKQQQYPECVSFFEKLYKKYPKSPRAVFGQAKCLEKLSEEMQSDQLLQNALHAYDKVTTLPNVPLELIKNALLAMGANYRFLGELRRSTLAYERLAEVLPQDYDALMNIGISYLYLNALKKAAPYFQQVLKDHPYDGWAMVHLGFVLYSLKQYPEAIRWLHDGIKTNDERVIEGKFFFYLGDAYGRIGDHHEAWKIYHLGAEKGLFISAMQRSLYNSESKLRSHPWWSVEESGYHTEIRRLEYHWRTIREEGLAALRKQKSLFQTESENLTAKGNWKQLELFLQGQKMKKGCTHAPKTCEIIEQMKSASTNQRGQVKFSLMEEGTHIWRHTGPTNCRLRVHLGLVIPDKTRIRVGEETRSWTNGKALIFDDSFEHEVWHDGEGIRLILIVDFFHPDLPDWEKKTLTPL